MPEDSWWPLALAASLALVFIGLIASLDLLAVAGGVLVAVSLAGWQWPREAAA